MASTDGTRGDLLGYLPPVWLGVVMGLSAWGLWSSWPLLAYPDVEAGIARLVYAGLGFGLFTILFGAWVLILFARGSPLFPRHFIIWQAADIAWLVIYQLWVALLDFAPTAEDLARVVAEIAIGAFCIAIVRRKVISADPTVQHHDLATPSGETMAGPPSGLAQVGVALLGIVLGGAVGFGLGLGLGILIAETTSMSCFEGACGFFAFFMGLGGLLLGAIAAPIMAVWWIRRRR